jgi:hypothetical protein
LTVGKILDLKGNFLAAQKEGIPGKTGQNRLLEDCGTVFPGTTMFCTSFVDKIVRKHFDSR